MQGKYQRRVNTNDKIALCLFIVMYRIGQGTVPGRPEEGSAASFVSTFFDGVSEEAFDNTMRVNAYGPYWLSFAFLPLLEKWKENGYGTEGHRFPPQIINTSSINGWTKVGLHFRQLRNHISFLAVARTAIQLAGRTRTCSPKRQLDTQQLSWRANCFPWVSESIALLPVRILRKGELHASTY